MLIANAEIHNISKTLEQARQPASARLPDPLLAAPIEYEAILIETCKSWALSETARQWPMVLP